MSLQKISGNNLVYFAALISIAIMSYIYFLKTEEAHKGITSFESCVKAGYPVLPTYPEECKIPGKIFTNPNQKKEELSPIIASTSIKSHLELTYLVSGLPVPIGTTTGQGVESIGVSHIADLNMDGLEDIVFVVEKKLTKKDSEYYLMLALGLHDGNKAAANGLLIGKVRPEKVAFGKSGVIEISPECSSTALCSSKFIVENDILKQP